MKYLSIVLLLSAPLVYGMDNKDSKPNEEVRTISREEVMGQVEINRAAATAKRALYVEQLKIDIIADINSRNLSKKDKLAYIDSRIAQVLNNQQRDESKFLPGLGEKLTYMEILTTLKKEIQVLPRRRTIFAGIESLPQQSIIPIKKDASSVNITRSLPIDIFKGVQKKTVFDLDEGAPTIARTLSVGVIDVIHEYPLVFTMEETDEEIAIRRKKEIIEEYGAENIRLNVSNRDAIKNDPGYATNHSYMVDYLDNRYAAKLVGLVKRDATWTNAEYYAAIEAQKEYLRSLLK